MLLRTSASSSLPLQHFHLSSETHKFPSHSLTLLPTHRTNPINCWIPQPYRHNTVDMDRERGSTLTWSTLYRRISNPSSGCCCSSVLEEWEKEKGSELTRWTLYRVAKQLIKDGNYKLALEVYEWMNERGKRFSLYSRDAAVQLDLLSKVRGIPSAKEYFSKLPESLKDHRTYLSLLNAYVKAKTKEDAESLMNEIKDKGYSMHAFPYNLMMTLYMKLNDFDKVTSMLSEMREKNVAMDTCSYNIWLTTCGKMGSIENMEAVLERMKLDSNIKPNWSTYSTMAAMYMNLGQVQKTIASLRMVEGRVTGRDRSPFHHLLCLYGRLGEKEEVYRIWNTYKASFTSIPNLGYRMLIDSLLRLDDIGGAEKFYHDWLSVKSRYDPRISNLLIHWYVRNGLLQKAEDFLIHVTEMGGKANSYTWELIAQGHIKEKRIPEALFCMEKASSMDDANNWCPNQENVVSFLSLCEKESDLGSKEAFMELLRKVGCFDNEAYMSLISSNGRADFGVKLSVNKDSLSNNDGVDDDGTGMILNQIEEAL